MVDDTLKLQAEIARLEAEANKFRREAEEIRWRMRPVWSYGKLLIASSVAGLTFVVGFYSVLKPYWDLQEKVIEGELRNSMRAKEEAKKQTEEAVEEAKKLDKSLTESFARGQDQLKAQQAAFKQRETMLLERINNLQANLRTEDGSSRGTASERAREIDRSIEALEEFKSKPLAQASKPRELRSVPKTIRYDEILATVRKNEFSLIAEKIEGSFGHEYVLDGEVDSIVIDRATNLMWERGGSPNTITFDKAKDYVDALNTENFGGYSDWRLPTIEELLSLLGPRPQNGALYIDGVFSDRQRWIISADNDGTGRGWGLVFYEGKLYRPTRNFPYFVRAVRTQK